MNTDSLEIKRYRIKDVCEILNIPASTLRFWEKEFSEIKPVRSQSNRRIYYPKDLEMLRIINYLVKTKGLKIEAAKQELKLNKKNISKRLEIIEELNNLKNSLQSLLNSLDKRRVNNNT